MNGITLWRIRNAILSVSNRRCIGYVISKQIYMVACFKNNLRNKIYSSAISGEIK